MKRGAKAQKELKITASVAQSTRQVKAEVNKNCFWRVNGFAKLGIVEPFS
jgi:hypothetical protein